MFLANPRPSGYLNGRVKRSKIPFLGLELITRRSQVRVRPRYLKRHLQGVFFVLVQAESAAKPTTRRLRALQGGVGYRVSPIRIN